ncbi:MAG: pirin family protein [Myxococcota bacterium]
MSSAASFVRRPLGFPWLTRDPFLFCVYHLDRYPAANARLGLNPSQLRGRRLGMDFELKDGFRMYHGQEVPGFPAHPHRGFETITLARQGFIDHSDSLGAKARFGQGDVQWMTAGRGIVHCEMFPLFDTNGPNTNELFQIWLNLPARSKMVEPHFSMLWGPSLPKVQIEGPAGQKAQVNVIAGGFGEAQAPSPPPNSWASDPSSDLAIVTFELDAKAEVRVPAARPGTLRTLYFFAGDAIVVDGVEVTEHGALEFEDHGAIALSARAGAVEVLMLQGRPIGEPVARHGPFVLNTEEEIVAAYRDYEHTHFGGWPWSSGDPVHDRDQPRFALHPDGREDQPA